jgi:alpha-tubulin suppressor-like RCC1 family protein
VGSLFACAVVASEVLGGPPASSVMCWGLNASGQLGTSAAGTTCIPLGAPAPLPCSPLPVTVNLPPGLVFTAVSADPIGYSACALTSTGTVYCWGEGFGETPVQASGLSGVIRYRLATIQPAPSRAMIRSCAGRG